MLIDSWTSPLVSVTLYDAHRDIAPDRAAAEAHRRAFKRDCGLAAGVGLAVCRSGHGGGVCHRPVACASAAATASNWCDCQCWKLAEAGTSVSVTAVTGMPRLRAASVIRLTSGVLFWL